MEDIIKTMAELISGDYEEDTKKMLKVQVEIINSTVATAKENLDKLGRIEEELKTDTVRETLRKTITELACQVMDLENQKEKLEKICEKYEF